MPTWEGPHAHQSVLLAHHNLVKQAEERAKEVPAAVQGNRGAGGWRAAALTDNQTRCTTLAACQGCLTPASDQLCQAQATGIKSSFTGQQMAAQRAGGSSTQAAHCTAPCKPAPHHVAMSARFTAAERTSGSSAKRRHRLRGTAGCQPPSSPSAAWLGGARPSRMGWLSSASAARGEVLAAVIAPGIKLRRPAWDAAGRGTASAYRALSALRLAVKLLLSSCSHALQQLFAGRVRRHRRVRA